MAKSKGKKKGSKGKKGKKNGPRKPTTTMPVSRVVSANTGPRNTAKRNHVTSICSITDPFCIHAKGAQRPDGGPPSIPFQIRALVQVLAAGTSGVARAVFAPNIGFGSLLFTYSVPTFTGAAAFVTTGGDGFVTGNAKEIRITSFGCIVRSAMTATTAKGLCIVSVDPAPYAGQLATAGSMQALESQVITLAAGMEHTWVSKPMGDSAHLFKPASSFTSTATDFDWTSLVVEVMASDTTNNVPLLTVEYVLNCEFTVVTGGASATTAIGMLQKAPPKPNRVAVAASQHAQATTSSFISGGISSATSFLENTAKSALDTIMSDGMALLFG
jgi:hypothetical protein